MLKKLRPDRFEDIIAANALYRPGPMENIRDTSRSSMARRRPIICIRRWSCSW